MTGPAGKDTPRGESTRPAAAPAGCHPLIHRATRFTKGALRAMTLPTLPPFTFANPAVGR